MFEPIVMSTVNVIKNITCCSIFKMCPCLILCRQSRYVAHRGKNVQEFQNVACIHNKKNTYMHHKTDRFQILPKIQICLNTTKLNITDCGNEQFLLATNL